MYGRPVINRAEIASVIDYGVRNGTLKLLEKKNLYTFGGVSVSLTDSELAEVMVCINSGKPIVAIKVLRGFRGINLAQAKSFVDHLGEILAKVRD